MRRLVALLLVSLLVSGELLTAVAFAQTDVHLRITANSLNVRSGPGTDFEVLASVKKGEVVVRLRESAGWVQIQLEAGTIGWVSDKYVEVAAAPPTAPPPPPEEPANEPPPPPRVQPSQQSGSSGGGSALGPIFKWSCLIGAVAVGGLAYNEKTKGDDAYDEYKSLVNQNMENAANVKFNEAEDHDSKAQTFAMVSGGLFVLWFAQQFVFGGGSSNFQADGAPLTIDPLNQNVQARVVLARF